MGLAKCIVPGCKDKKSRRLRIPHPVLDTYHRYWKWLALIQNSEMVALDPMYVYKNKRVCTRHFSPDRFVFGTKKLKRSALPDINIGECHSVIKDKDGNVRHDSLCLDLKELSKDNCTLKDIDIGGDIDDPVLGDTFKPEATFSKETDATDRSIARNYRTWPNGEERVLVVPSLSQRLDSSDNPPESNEEFDTDENDNSQENTEDCNTGISDEADSSQENIEDCNTGNSYDEAFDPQESIEDCNNDYNADETHNIDHGSSTQNDGNSPGVASTSMKSESTVCRIKEGTDILRSTPTGEEDSLVLFFSKAHEVASKFPQELQRQIKKDILDSILRAQSLYRKIKVTAKI